MILPRLYAILDVDLALRRHLDPETICAEWLEVGVRLVQLRAKTLATGSLLRLAERLVARTRDSGAWLIVNDRPDVAHLAAADGVHVGQDDLAPGAIRRAFFPERFGGSSAVIGLSTHNDTQVRAGLVEPIDYLAFGPVFATATKERPDATVGLDGIRAAAARAATAGIPLVAIGGITEANARSVVAAGADAVAIAADLTGPNAAERARTLLGVLLGLVVLAISSTPHVLSTS